MAQGHASPRCLSSAPAARACIKFLCHARYAALYLCNDAFIYRRSLYRLPRAAAMPLRAECFSQLVRGALCLSCLVNTAFAGSLSWRFRSSRMPLMLRPSARR